MDSAAFAVFQKDASAALVALIRTAKALTSGDLPFNRSLDPHFAATLDSTNSHILTLINALVRNVNVAVPAEPFEDAESLEARWAAVSDVVDSLLERADMCIDEYSGTVNRGSMQQQQQQHGPVIAGSKSARPDKRHPDGRKAYFKSLNMPKPQLLFQTPLSPLDPGPYRPRLTRKPHALVPLEQSLVPLTADATRERYISSLPVSLFPLLLPPSSLPQLTHYVRARSPRLFQDIPTLTIPRSASWSSRNDYGTNQSHSSTTTLPLPRPSGSTRSNC